jgi:release factor glutamine methyltransferase
MPRTVAGAIGEAREALLTAGVPPDEAPGDAEVLARHALGWDLTQFALHRNDRPPAGFEQAYSELVARRRRREPVSQIVGHREFWGLDFVVTRDVLTPRPETETLVEAALAVLPRDTRALIADVGTGSGCLAVALAIELPSVRVIATDISPAALAIARVNASRHRVQDRIRFVEADLLPPLDHVDLIVSNPPYVALSDAATLAPEVRDHEPHAALFAGANGLDVYGPLVRTSRDAIAADGRLILELGYNQSADVIALARAAGWEADAVRQDLQGIERALTLRPVTKDR